MTVQERIDLLRKAGVTIHHEYEYVGQVGTPERHREDLPGTFSSVLIPFGAEEWMSIAQNEGEHYVGGCCGEMSALQDQIDYAFRFGGSVDSSELHTIGEHVHNHGGPGLFDPMDDLEFDHYVEVFDELSPWDKLGVIYNAVQPVLKTRDMEAWRIRGEEEGKEGQDVISDLSRGLNHRNWQDLFEVREETRSQHVAQRRLDLAKIYPLALNLVQQIEQSDLDFEGFAVVDGNGDLATNGFGSCIYTDEAKAQEVVDITKGEFRVVPCSVNLAEGLVLK